MQRERMNLMEDSGAVMLFHQPRRGAKHRRVAAATLEYYKTCCRLLQVHVAHATDGTAVMRSSLGHLQHLLIADDIHILPAERR